MFYAQSLFFDSPAKNPAEGLGVWLLTCAAGQSLPNLAVGVCGPWGWSIEHARRKPELGLTSLERWGAAGGAQLLFSATLRGGYREGRARLLTQKHKRPQAQVTVRKIPDAAFDPWLPT